MGRGSCHGSTGQLFRALSLTIAHGKIREIDVIADPARLRELDIAVISG
jgi:hypothetical protein